MPRNALILELNHVDLDYVDLVGKDAGELGELIHLEIPITPGFIITTTCFIDFFKHDNLTTRIKKILDSANPKSKESVNKATKEIQRYILHSNPPSQVIQEILNHYKKMSGLFKESAVAIFSSSPFHAKKIIFPKVRGDANLILKIQTIWASQFNEKAIVENRIPYSEDISKFATAVVIQKIPNGDLETIDTENQIKDKGLSIVAQKIKKYFYFPQEIKYIRKKNKIYILKIKPLANIKVREKVAKEKFPLFVGVPRHPGIATGYVRIVKNPEKIQKISPGEIIILSKIDLKSFRYFKSAKALVIDEFITTNHSKTFLKNLNIPIVTGAKDATKTFKNGAVITVNGQNGEIYRGGLI